MTHLPWVSSLLRVSGAPTARRTFDTKYPDPASTLGMKKTMALYFAVGSSALGTSHIFSWLR